MSDNDCGCGGHRVPEHAAASACGGKTVMDRREFVVLAGVGGASVAMGPIRLPTVAGPFRPQDATDHFVPADKKLAREWVEALHLDDASIPSITEQDGRRVTVTTADDAVVPAGSSLRVKLSW